MADDKIEVSRLSSLLVRKFGDSQPGAAMLKDLARGMWDWRCCVCLWQNGCPPEYPDVPPEGPFDAMTVLATSQEAGSARLTCFSVAENCDGADLTALLEQVIEAAAWESLPYKCTRLEIDASLSTQPLNATLQKLGCRPTDQAGIWLANVQPESLLSHARSIGQGRGSWHVVVYDDDHTPVEIVANTLHRVLDLQFELAWLLTMAIHIKEQATVSSHRFRWMAERMRRRLSEMFKFFGYSIRMETHPSPPAG
ncbi:MAG: ATP-dependent Clp protease adaptor ClpS [Planctomycetes bacterium]|nr:ATP-dependent Clp protease adaptor ClpS [Planctomycetota bacterium]